MKKRKEVIDWPTRRRFGKDLKAILKRENIPHYLFGEAMGVTGGAVSKYISGETFVDAEILQHMFRALNSVSAQESLHRSYLATYAKRFTSKPKSILEAVEFARELERCSLPKRAIKVLGDALEGATPQERIALREPRIHLLLKTLKVGRAASEVSDLKADAAASRDDAALLTGLQLAARVHRRAGVPARALLHRLRSAATIAVARGGRDVATGGRWWSLKREEALYVVEAFEHDRSERDQLPQALRIASDSLAAASTDHERAESLYLRSLTERALDGIPNRSEDTLEQAEELRAGDLELGFMFDLARVDLLLDRSEAFAASALLDKVALEAGAYGDRYHELLAEERLGQFLVSL